MRLYNVKEKIMVLKIGPEIVKLLYQPPPGSHKGENGQLMIVAGSERYHGAPVLAAQMAGKIVDLVFFSSVLENNELIKKMEEKLCEFIALPQEEIYQYAKQCDCILLGPGMGISQATKKITNDMLKKFPQKKFVLDADALKMVNPKLLGPNCLLTPHQGEFEILFKIKASFANAAAMAKKYHCIILLKGQVDYICSSKACAENHTGNAGMTKGGTGDILAGLVAGLACKNDLFLAACAAALLCGLAGDRLFKKVSYYYSASDLISEVPKTIKWFLNKELESPRERGHLAYARTPEERIN